MKQQRVVSMEEYLADLSVSIDALSEMSETMINVIRANQATDERVVNAALSAAEHHSQKALEHVATFSEHLNMANLTADLTEKQREVLAARLGLTSDEEDGDG